MAIGAGQLFAQEKPLSQIRPVARGQVEVPSPMRPTARPYERPEMEAQARARPMLPAEYMLFSFLPDTLALSMRPTQGQARLSAQPKPQGLRMRVGKFVVTRISKAKRLAGSTDAGLAALKAQCA